MMSQYGQVEKSCAYMAVPKWVFGSILQGLRTQMPHKHIQAPRISMNTTQIPPDTPQTYHRHPQDISREHNMPTDANRHRETPQDTDRCCLSMSGGVNWRLLLSVGILCSLEMSGGCLGDVWGVSEFLGSPEKNHLSQLLLITLNHQIQTNPYQTL